MARSIPAEPAFTTPSEHEVWERLVHALPADVVLLPNLRLTDDDKDHELDLVVLWPDVGCVVLEVKGGSVWYDGEWWSKSGGAGIKERRIHPVDQAREGKYALRTFVEADPRWGSRPRIAWAHGVVTPYSRFDEDFALPDLPRWALHDRQDQADLRARVEDNLWRGGQGALAPSSADVDQIVEILTGRRSSSYDVNAEADERAAAAERLTQEQALILKVTRLLNRVEVRGGAGSGKTVLAVQQARELSRKGERVALLCYSIGLAEHFKRVVAGWPRRHQPAFVGTWEMLGRSWGAPKGAREDSDFWENRLPALIADLASDLPDGKRYDAIVVDEAQDFADTWWRPLLKALPSEEDGGLYVFADENQRVFSRFGRPPVELVPLVLDHCLRNTRQVFDAFAPMAPGRMFARGGDGPEVRFVACAAEDAEEAADDEVVRLLDEEGWEPGKVALITTGHRHFVQTQQVEELGQEGYWSTYFEGDEVFYGHVLGCKGLERPVVVLCLNEDGTRDRARERLYVGMSRATDQLVVVGDPEAIRRAGGDQVARRLGL